MATIEERIQKTVASLEAGELAKLLWRVVFVVAAIGLSVFYLIHEFRGLPTAQSMDQAQIGRELLRGHGWQTKLIRPLAVGELERHGKDVNSAIWHDTYNSPIPPLLDAAAIYLPIKNGWDFNKLALVYSGDRAIAIMGISFFLAAVVVLYLIARELFDRRLATMAAGLVLVCDMMWRYSISGLSLTFLLFLLHLNIYFLLRAMRARYLNRSHVVWLALIGLGFGLMALTNAVTIFIFVPLFLFALVFFRPRLLGALLMLAVFAAVYIPWLLRNAAVCGDFRGLAGFAGLDGIAHTEAGNMRRFAIDPSTVSGNYYEANFRANLIPQINRLIEFMGWSCVAPIAFVSVVHAFKRPITATFRWLLFAMWAGAVCGMSVFGMKEDGAFFDNQLHLLFLPLFICYGMAYLLVQWDRRIGLGFIIPQWGDRSAVHNFLRSSLVVAVFILSSLPILGRIFLTRNGFSVEWPPYAPPYIAVMHDWFKPDEIIASDMPWAVAWYADRRSIWLPFSRASLSDLSDYKRLGGTVAALYLTPISGTQNTLGDLIDGEYREWGGYIVRTANYQNDPYPYKSLMGMRECIIYMIRPVPKSK